MRDRAFAFLFFVLVLSALFAPLTGCPHYRQFDSVVPPAAR